MTPNKDYDVGFKLHNYLALSALDIERLVLHAFRNRLPIYLLLSIEWIVGWWPTSPPREPYS